MTCIVIQEVLVNTQVRLQGGDQHLLPPVEHEVLPHLYQLGHVMVEYSGWQGQRIQDECLSDPPNPSQGLWWGC